MHVAIIGLPSRPVQGHNPQTHRLGVDHRCLTAGEHDELTDCWWGGEVMEKKTDQQRRLAMVGRMEEEDLGRERRSAEESGRCSAV